MRAPRARSSRAQEGERVLRTFLFPEIRKLSAEGGRGWYLVLGS